MHWTEVNPLAIAELVVGLKENSDVPPSPQQELVSSSRMLVYEPTHIIHLQSSISYTFTN